MIRVLHFLGDFVGGDWTFLRQVLHRIPRDAFQMDFLLTRQTHHDFDDEIRAAGSQIFACQAPPKPQGLCLNFDALVREHGPYQVFHNHAQSTGGYAMWRARQLGIPVRIAHSHVDPHYTDRQAHLLARLYRQVMRRFLIANTTHGLGVSRLAVEAQFGPDWERDERFRVLFFGIDFAPFRAAQPREAVRQELGLPEAAWVILHTGRFHAQKNHAFLVEVAREVVKDLPQALFVLIGDGPLRPQIEQQVTAAGLDEHFRFLGFRTDVPRLMPLGDMMLFPSLYEGLGVSLLEAQAVGMPYLTSDEVPPEVDVIPELAHRLALGASPTTWAERIRSIHATGYRLANATAIERMEASVFNLDHCIQELLRVYRLGSPDG